MEVLHGLAARLEETATAVTTSAAPLGGLTYEPGAFGADAPGRLGDVGRALHSAWAEALPARQREAARAAALLAGTAEAVRRAAGAYTDADDAAAHRLRRAGS
jgi:hypothetical protein